MDVLFCILRINMRDFKSVDQQIEILRDRKLIFLNEETARLNLMRYGYYEIINGYKDFILENKNPDIYKEGETFEHMFSLFLLDKSLKRAVLNSSLTFEMNIKTVFSYVLSDKYGVKYNSYLNRKFYKLGKKNKQGKYQLDSLFDKFNLIINDNLQPYKHYRIDHGHTPPWILFKGCSFGNIKYFYNLQKSPIKEEITSLMLDFPIDFVKEYPDIKNFFSDLLNLVYLFRNRSAHSGRIYNYKPNNSKIRFFKPIHSNKHMNITESEYRLGYGINDLYTLSKSLCILENFDPAIELISGIRNSISNHLDKYPKDRDFLLSNIGVPPNQINNNLNKIL